MDGIEYRELYDYAGVFAGSDGNIYRVTESEVIDGVRYVDLAPIKKYVCGNYETVHIMRRDCSMVTANVHALVCMAFHDKPKVNSVLHVRHLNGNSFDNRACNLAYGTPHDNWEDKIVARTATIGEKNHNAKLTDAERLEAYTMYYEKGVSQRRIAQRYVVTQGAVSKILKRCRAGSISAD